MIHFERSLTIDASPDAVWAVLGRYMHADDYCPEITSVEALTDGEDGVGSRRKNIFKNSSYMVEEVTAWHEGKGFTIKATDMPGMPLKAASSTVRIDAVGCKSKVTWTFDFKVKFGPLGWLMGQTMMKTAMGKIIDANLKGLASKATAA